MFKLLASVALATVAMALCAEDNHQRVILLTAFEPFGRSTINTSWEVVKKFDGKEIGGFLIKTLQLKVVYDAIEQPLKSAIAEFKPSAVISFGEGSETLRIETVAANGYHPVRPPDNAGRKPPREMIVPDGAAEIKTGFDVAALGAKLKAANVEHALSKDAGGYLCNECFYRLMALKDAPVVRGFVHVPHIEPAKESELKKLEADVGVLILGVAEQAAKK